MDNPADQNVPAAPPKQPARKSPALAVLAIAAVLLLAAGIAFFAWLNWPKPTSEKTAVLTPPSVRTAPVPTSTPTVQEQKPEAPSATGTAVGTDNHKLGETVRLFEGDAFYVLNKQAFPAYWISVNRFTDSRCPKDVQCIWAGERGIELQITLEGTEALPQQVTLSETTRRSAQVSGLKMTLIEIGDEKGGTYADVKFE